jgi:hypothetical protein
VGRILSRIGKGAIGAATGAAAGGPLGAVAGAAGSIRGSGCSPAGKGSVLAAQPRISGGSLEDQIAAFFRQQLKQVESELQGAMQEAQSGGGSSGSGEGGDSRALASSKVQQLVQKRSEMIEMLTNAMKTSHDTSLAVARNLK